MSVLWSLPENLARIRKARDLSQEQLAAAAGVAVDTVARIERAERQTTRPATVHKLATALNVSSAALLGISSRPWAPIDVAELRHAITATVDIPGLTDFTETVEVLPLQVLTATAHRAWRAYVDGRHGELLHALPPLLFDALRLVHASNGDKRAAAYRVLSTAYRLGAGIAGRYAVDDLAWISAERALLTARQSNSPSLETAISMRYMVWTLVRQGRAETAERVAISAAVRIEPRMLDSDPDRVGVFGNLLFNAALAAIRGGHGDRARILLNEAHAAAVRAGCDTASEAAIFGPRVAWLQAVEHAFRLGDAQRALHLAASAPEANGDVPAFWEAGHRILLAAATAKLHDERRSLNYLAQAKALAPDWVQHQPLGVSTMRDLVDRATRRRGKAFAALAAHYGVIS